MRLIENYRVVLEKLAVTFNLGKQHTVSHNFDDCLVTEFLIKTNPITHCAAKVDVQFASNPAGDTACSNTAGLGVRDTSRPTPTSCHADFRQLGTFPGSGFTTDHGHLMALYQLHDFRDPL